MRKVILSLAALAISISSFAQLSGDGYYRIKNKATGRYISVSDNKATASATATDIDMMALKTFMDFGKVVSDPGSVIYIQKTGSGYILKAQGCDTHQMTDAYLQLIAVSDAYRAYGTSGGVTIYLSDENTQEEEGVVLTSGSKTRDWYINQISQSADNCLGLTPDFWVGRDYYTTFYASFPFSFASSGMKAYYIGRTSAGYAELKEVEGDIIPAATPVIVKCSSTKPEENMLTPLASGGQALAGNSLTGAYFCNSFPGHINRVENDQSSMRVLGLNSEGNLALVMADCQYMPANKAYIAIPENATEIYSLVTPEEYDALVGVENIVYSAKTTDTGIYTVTGIKVREESSSFEGLPNGLYIVNGEKKVIIK